MPLQPPILAQNSQRAKSRELWLRKHADYQRVYRQGKRQSLPLITYFFAARTAIPSSESTLQAVPQLHSRVGLTAGKVLGNAVERNRIKRRMREAVRRHSSELAANVDVILHPRRQVLEVEFSQIERDVRRAFQAIGTAMETRDDGSNRP